VYTRRDYENVRIPAHASAVTVTQRSLRAVAENAAQRLGFNGLHRIVERRLYYDSRRRTEVKVDRSGLDASFTIVDCPSRNKKETLDKKIIVDLMSFVHARTAHGASVCVVLVSSDGDYGYMLSRLRDHGAYVVIIYNSNVSSAYLESADYTLHWRDEVLRDLDGAAAAIAVAANAVALDAIDGWDAPAAGIDFGGGGLWPAPVTEVCIGPFLDALDAFLAQQPGQRVAAAQLHLFYDNCNNQPTLRAAECRKLIKDTGGYRAFCGPGGPAHGRLYYTPDPAAAGSAWLSKSKEAAPEDDGGSTDGGADNANDSYGDSLHFGDLGPDDDDSHTQGVGVQGGAPEKTGAKGSGGGVGGSVITGGGGCDGVALGFDGDSDDGNYVSSGADLSFLDEIPPLGPTLLRASSDDSFDGRHRLFLLCLRAQQQLAMRDPRAKFEEVWVRGDALAQEFYRRKRVSPTLGPQAVADAKELFKLLRASALAAGFIEVARQRKSGAAAASAPGTLSVSDNMVKQARWAAYSPDALSLDLYVRLTQAGARADEEIDNEEEGQGRLRPYGPTPPTTAPLAGFNNTDAAIEDASKADDAPAAPAPSLAMSQMVGPAGASLRCNRGADCYYLRRGKCTYLHPVAEARAAGSPLAGLSKSSSSLVPHDTGVLAEGAAEYAAAGVADTVATAAAAALQDAAVAAALGRGVHAYTVNELLALRAAHCAPPDAAPACFLGLQDAAAVSAMLARLPQPWSEKAPSGNSSSGGGGGGGGSAGNKGSQRKRNAAKKEERQVKPKDSLCGDNSNGRELSGGSAASEGQVSAGSENTGAAVYEPSPASVNKNTDHEMAK